MGASSAKEATMGFIRSIAKKFQNGRDNLTWRQAFSILITGFFLLLFALFFDWLIINWISGCCEGGVCIPEWLYPQCQNQGGQP